MAKFDTISCMNFSSGSPERSEGITRREFVFGCVPAGLIAFESYVNGSWLTGISQVLVKMPAPSALSAGNTADHEFDVSREERDLNSEIIAYRQKLGFHGLPAEVTWTIESNKQWDKAPEAFEINTQEKNRSYGMMVEYITREILGDNATRIVKSAAYNSADPTVVGFENHNQTMQIPDSAHQIFDLPGFTVYILHEIIGHGTDPALGATPIYPPQLIAAIEHGKWRALSQAFSVEGQFLNHPKDMMYPVLKRKIGSTVGQSMVGKKENELTDSNGVEILHEEISKLAATRGRSLETIKYTKKVCSDLGERLVTLLRAGKFSFKGELEKAYTDAVEEACIEVYAEMVKYAICYPEKIGHNPDIIGGVTEIISAIRGKPVDLESLRQNITTIRSDILERYQAEAALVTNAIAPVNVPALSPGEIEKMKRDREELDRQEKAYRLFTTEGILPDNFSISDEQRSILQTYAKFYSLIIQRYPALNNEFELEYNRYNASFDPDLHMWETQKIEKALKPSIVREIIKNPGKFPETYVLIEQNRDILRRFINSPSF